MSFPKKESNPAEALAGISSNRPNPLYQQVKEYILEQIESGSWLPNSRVPSENELVEQMGVSRMTANRALRELTNAGRLVRIQGVGTFVAPLKPQGALLEIKSISDEIVEWGGRHTCEVILLTEEKVDGKLAEAMELAIGAPVFHSILVHKDNERPVQHSDRYVNPAVAPNYLRQDFTQITPNQYLLSVAPVQEAEHIIEAALPDREIQKLLKIGPKEPCIVQHRRTWSFNVVATRSILTYPGSRYRLGGRFKASSTVQPMLV